MHFAESQSVKKLLSEWDASSARLLEVVAALQKITWGREEKKDKAGDMLFKVKRLYEPAQSRVVTLRVLQVLKIWEMVDRLTDEVEAKAPELQTIPGLLAESSLHWEKTAKLREVAKNDEANVVVLVVCKIRWWILQNL